MYYIRYLLYLWFTIQFQDKLMVKMVVKRDSESSAEELEGLSHTQRIIWRILIQSAFCVTLLYFSRSLTRKVDTKSQNRLNIA
jgi:hypothetical protein